MSRVKSSVQAHSRHKKVIKAAKGYRGRRKSCFRVATQAVDKAGQYAYRDRKVKNAISAACGLSASMRQPAPTA